LSRSLATAILLRKIALATGNRQQATGNRQQATGNYTLTLTNLVNYLTAYIYSPHVVFSQFILTTQFLFIGAKSLKTALAYSLVEGKTCP
jgi:hypothetical protein